MGLPTEPDNEQGFPHEAWATSPEQPIQSSDEDKLDRSAFVERLCNALISSKTKKATGVVIGITGAWGSGKSSIINLLEEEIYKIYEVSIIVRFDPWLISGREDLIREFFQDMIASMQEEQESIKEKIHRYSRGLSRGIRVVQAFGKLTPASGLLDILSELATSELARDQSLHELREELRSEFVKLDRPVVILIDELDRVEDDEVRKVAQLVRAVADFPNVSYVLAYDQERVIEALGSGARGQAYLEKIVQLQIPLPFTLPSEITCLFVAEIDRIAESVGLSKHWHGEEKEHFKKLIDLVVPNFLSTPRDVKRIVGVFHVMSGALNEDVNSIDILGFLILQKEFPDVIRFIQRDMSYFCSDCVRGGFGDDYRVFSPHDNDENAYIKKVFGDEVPGERILSLLVYLFPLLKGDYGAARGDRKPIYFEKNLCKVLRFGIPISESIALSSDTEAIND